MIIKYNFQEKLSSMNRGLWLMIFIVFFSIIFLPNKSAVAAGIHYNADQLILENVYREFEDNFQLTLPSKQYSVLDVYVFQKNTYEFPQDANLLGQVYDFYILSPEVTDDSLFKITLGYTSDSLSAKDIYLWDFKEKTWQKQDSVVDLEKKSVSAVIKGRKGLVGVFEAARQVSVKENVSYYNQFFLKFPQSILKNAPTTTIEAFTALNYTEEKNRVSHIFQFDIKSEQQLDFIEPLELIISYPQENNIRKAIYYWDNNKNKWIYLPSHNDFYNKTVSAYIHLPFSRIALFEESNQLIGEASWYKWKNGNFGATRDFPKGTKLKVTNITKTSKNFGKSVVITINDFGPEEWTGRIIDLDKVAFGKIGNLKGGVMPVLIEKIE